MSNKMVFSIDYDPKIHLKTNKKLTKTSTKKN